MKRQKLQIVGWVAALLCCAVLWTAPAMAEEVKYELWIAGKQLTSENCTNISKDNGFLGVTVAEGGECRYDKEKNTLFMTGVTIEPGDNKSAIVNYIRYLKIQVDGKNYWKTTNRSALFNNGEQFMSITGEEGKASLEVTSSDSAAVFVHRTVAVHNIKFTATGKWGVLGKDPTHPLCNFSLHSAKGTITATSTEEDVSALMNIQSLNDDNMLYVEPRRAICIYDWGTKVLIYTEKPNNGKKVKALTFERKYQLNIGNIQVDAENCKNLVANSPAGITVGNEGHLRYDPACLILKKVDSKNRRIFRDADT